MAVGFWGQEKGRDNHIDRYKINKKMSEVSACEEQAWRASLPLGEEQRYRDGVTAVARPLV